MCQKSQSCLFGAHGILEGQIPNPDLDFSNSDPEIYFLANLGQKNQICPVWLKIDTQSVPTMLILIPTLFFSVSNPKSFFGQIWAEKFKVVHKLGTHGISRMLILIPTIVFCITNPRSTAGQIWAEKFKVVCFALKLAHSHMYTQYLEDVDSYCDISFLKRQT